MSGYTEAGDVAKAFNEDQLVFLSKPLSPAKLDETIRRLLRLPGKLDKQVA
jgi:DNA-binding NtrC family response regulator